MNRSISWDLYRSFAAVMRDGSFSAAARTLGLTQPTVARQIAALEHSLGVELFIRSHHGLTPTAAAARLSPHIETLMQTTAALVRDVSHDRGVSGTVRITAGEMIAIHYLPPILGEVRRAYPQLQLELSLTERIEDLQQREADIAVRLIEPRQQGLVRRLATTVTLHLYAHRDYLAQKGEPSTVDDLANHDLIGYDAETPVTRAATAPFPWLGRPGFALRTDSVSAQLAAMNGGLGIGYTLDDVAARYPCLRRVLGQSFALEYPIWIVMHEDLRKDPAAGAVFDALADGWKSA